MNNHERIEPGRIQGDPLLYTAEETAWITRLGRTTVFRLIAEGALSSIQVGRSRRITRESIEAFIQSRQEGGE